jgi:tetratricopeptide (TPR) repeat protein
MRAPGTCLIVFALVLVTFPALAQENSKEKAGDEDDSSGQTGNRPLSEQPVYQAVDHPYVSPGAVKDVEVGDFYLKRGKYRAALSRYQEAVASNAYYAPAYLGLGKVYDHLRDKPKALDNYRKYLDLLPSAKDAENARDVQKAIARLEHQHPR